MATSTLLPLPYSLASPLPSSRFPKPSSSAFSSSHCFARETPPLILPPSRRRLRPYPLGGRRRGGGGVRAAYVTAPASDPDAIDRGPSPEASAPKVSSPAAAISWGGIWSLLLRHKLRMAISLASLVGCTCCTLSMPLFSGKEYIFLQEILVVEC